MAALLEVDHLSKSFGGLHVTDDVSFVVEEGEIRSVIGPNGAGKTTLFNQITGYLRPNSGEVRLGGSRISGLKPHQIVRRGMARAFQITNVFPRLTVFENVQSALIVRRNRVLDLAGNGGTVAVDAVWELLDAVGLREQAHLRAGVLSHGDQRALEVAIALGSGPRLLLLDEPTAGMSPYETARTVELIRRIATAQRLTVLFSEHDMDVVFGISDRVTVLHQGRVIAEGTPAEVRGDAEVVRVYLGT
jgi:branched-chain amino acid transport system ATP-binding protein